MIGQVSFLFVLIIAVFLLVAKAFVPKQPVPGRGYAVVSGERWGDFESKDLSVNNKCFFHLFPFFTSLPKMSFWPLSIKSWKNISMI